MGIECINFVSQLSELFTIKRDLPKPTATSWVRTKLCFDKINIDMFTWFTLD